MPKHSHRLNRREVYRGRFLRMQLDRVREPGGRVVDREVIRHPGAAVILASDTEGRIVLVRQYRYAVDEFLLEAPAGHIEPGEDPAQTARRELLEETGYVAGRLSKLAEFFPAPGFCDERMHLYEACELHLGQARPEPDELIEVELVRHAEALELARKGKIRDAKTLVALFLGGEMGLWAASPG